MLDQLQEISTSAIDELIAVKKQREVLAARLERLAAEQGKVPAVVFERVRGDYESQLGQLEQRAAPLKAKARQEYSKLEKLLESVQGELDSKQLDHEEIQVRHMVGEFDDDEFETRGAEIKKLLEKHQRDLDEISTVKDRFVAAFDSEDDLRQAAEPAPEPEPEPSPAGPSPSTPPPSTQPGEPLPPPTPRALDLPPEGDTGPIEERKAPAEDVEDAVPEPPPAAESAVPEPPPAVESAVPEPPPAAESAVPEPPPAVEDAVPEPPPPAAEPPPVEGVQAAEPAFEEGDATMTRAPPTEEESSRPLTGATVLISTPSPLPDMADGGSGATSMLPLARLVPEEPIFGITEFPVEPLTLIGRTPQNQVQINDPAVSRRHSEIMLTDEGYLLRDLGSENGTYVNGERIQEQILAEGDRVQIGTIRFVFSTSMPGSGPPVADSPE